MAKKTRFGQDLRHVSWLSSEFQAMQRLYEAGADIPQPIAQSDNAILMEYMGDENVPAPTLINVTLTREEAPPLFDKLIGNIDLMLSLNLVHGDLSAHNVLYWEGEGKIIDFPQAVDPDVNPSAFTLLERDVARICQYFARYGVTSDPARIAAEIWARYVP
jgi:RIO kinase 1